MNQQVDRRQFLESAGLFTAASFGIAASGCTPRPEWNTERILSEHIEITVTEEQGGTHLRVVDEQLNDGEEILLEKPYVIQGQTDNGEIFTVQIEKNSRGRSPLPYEANIEGTATPDNLSLRIEPGTRVRFPTRAEAITTVEPSGRTSSSTATLVNQDNLVIVDADSVEILQEAPSL